MMYVLLSRYIVFGQRQFYPQIAQIFVLDLRINLWF